MIRSIMTVEILIENDILRVNQNQGEGKSNVNYVDLSLSLRFDQASSHKKCQTSLRRPVYDTCAAS